MGEPFSALGATSFAFLLLGKCVQGFVLLSQAQNIGKVGTGLVCLLNIQEVRLTEWARRCGLLVEPHELDARLNERLVNAVLGQLDALLGDVDKLAGRYNFSLVANGSDGPDHATPRGLINDLVSDELRRDILFRARLIKSRNVLPKRLWWAGVDAHKFRELVRNISDLVDGLEQVYDAFVREDMARKIDQIITHRIFRSRTAEEAQTLQAALQLDAENSNRGSSLATLAELRDTRLQVGDLSDEPADKARHARIPISDDRLLDFDKVTNFVGMGGREAMGTARYDGVESFVEFRTTPTDPIARGIILTRARNLGRFLLARKHPVFRTLHCKGVAIAPDESKLFFVFDLPRSGSRPVALLGLFSSSQSPLPSVEARIRLAVRLIDAMKHIHAAGWIHRNIRSENILFFTRRETAESLELHSDSAPYIAGFAFARLDVSGYSEDNRAMEPTRDIYRHPVWLADERQKSEPFMDVYSLGVMLVELAAWQPLKHIVREVVDVRKNNLSKTQVQKARACIQDRSVKKQDSLYLPYRMGSIYASVVKRYLEIERAETEDALDALDEAVVNLRRCVV